LIGLFFTFPKERPGVEFIYFRFYAVNPHYNYRVPVKIAAEENRKSLAEIYSISATLGHKSYRT